MTGRPHIFKMQLHNQHTFSDALFHLHDHPFFIRTTGVVSDDPTYTNMANTIGESLKIYYCLDTVDAYVVLPVIFNGIVDSISTKIVYVVNLG
jgi:hypothetical protein